MLEGRARVFFAMGGNFLSADARHRAHRGGAAALPPDRARVDEAATAGTWSPARRRSSCRASAAPRWTCRPGRRSSSPSRTRWASCTPRAGRCRLRASISSARRASSPASRARRWAIAAPPHRLGGAGRRLRPHPRAHRARRPGLRGLRGEGPGAGGLSPAQRGARARVGHADAARRASSVSDPPGAPSSGPGQLLMMTVRSHDQYNTTVYGLDDRYRGVRRRAARRADERRRRARAGPRRRATWWTSTSHFDDGERIAKRFAVVALRHPARLLRDVLPRGQRARTARIGGAEEQHPGQQVGRGDRRARRVERRRSLLRAAEADAVAALGRRVLVAERGPHPRGVGAVPRAAADDALGAFVGALRVLLLVGLVGP